MRRFVEEADRGQWTLLPQCLDDFIDESNPVRVIDVFVDALDLAEMSFEGGGAGGRYLSQLDTADRQEPTEALADTLGSWLPGPMFLRDRFYTTKTHSRTR